MVLLGRKESWGGDSLMFSQSHLGAGGIDVSPLVELCAYLRSQRVGQLYS